MASEVPAPVPVFLSIRADFDGGCGGENDCLNCCFICWRAGDGLRVRAEWLVSSMRPFDT